ncbi:hypothetical protein R69888_05569 [Paraburkholderia haematera]|uniref:Uncharacterized protein n=1 Tax=Paraburkholderia haematera TaxID=2793077 RepID=A0ABM8SH60_9BURK|nr:hypothetical protein R69888_05569 [Paraburkholderia haematera]
MRTLTQWLSHDILALAGPALATRQTLFDVVVQELAAREPQDARRIRPVRVALQSQRDDLLAFAGVLDAKLAGIAQAAGVPDDLVRAACLLHRNADHIARVLARLGAVTIKTGQPVPRRLRRRRPGHRTHAAQQCAGGKPQLAAAQLLHAAAPYGQLVP